MKLKKAIEIPGDLDEVCFRTERRLVLNKSGKPIGERDLTITRDLMCYAERGKLFLVKPAINERRP